MGKVDGLLVGLAALSAAFYIYGLWDKPFIAFSSNILFPVYALISAIFGFDVARRYGLRSLLGAVFFFLALGLFIWCIGEIVWAIYVLAFSIEVPLPLTCGRILHYRIWLILYRFLHIMKVFRYVFSERAIIVPSIVSGLLILAITSFTVVPEAFAQSSNIVEAVLAVAYPMHDAALIALAVIALMVFWGGKLAKGWLYLLTGFMLTGLVDIFYYYYDLLGLIWEGHPLELLWLFSYLAMAKGFHDVWIGRE